MIDPFLGLTVLYVTNKYIVNKLMEELLVPIEESCNDCAKQTSCEKATHFENYTLNGCSQFKPKKIFPINVEEILIDDE